MSAKPPVVKDGHLKVNAKWLWCVLYNDTTIVSYTDDTCVEEVGRVMACEALVKVRPVLPGCSLGRSVLRPLTLLPAGKCTAHRWKTWISRRPPGVQSGIHGAWTTAA